MSEIVAKEVVKNIWSTTTRRDYVPKSYSRATSLKINQEFKDPIAASFSKFLTIDVQDEPSLENGEKYLEQVRKLKSKKIADMYFKEPLDLVTITQDKLLDKITEYQYDYCDVESTLKKTLPKEKKAITFPEGWTFGETSQKLEFKNPILINKRIFDPPLVRNPETSLGQNEKINQILDVKTGDTTYETEIGKFGKFAIKHQLHGKILYPKLEYDNP